VVNASQTLLLETPLQTQRLAISEEDTVPLVTAKSL